MTTGNVERVVVVGASLAGLRAATVLRAEGYANELTLIDPETSAPYDRPPLSKKFLTDELTRSDIALRGADLEATWMRGVWATGLDVKAQRVATSAGDDVPYDALVVATGSRPKRMPALPVNGTSVFELRTVGDAVALRNALAQQPKVAIVGGGFIGIEVASTCRSLDCEVALISPMPLLTGLTEMVSGTVERLCSAHSVDVYRQAAVGLGHQAGQRGVRTAGGQLVPADIVVVAIGAVPEVSWLQDSAIPIADGIACDSSGHVIGHDNIFAAGDVARWMDPRDGSDGMRAEHWTNAVEQGALVARHLLRGRAEGHPAGIVPSFWSDHFGRRIQVIGTPTVADRAEILEGSVDHHQYGAALYRHDTLVGAIGYGMPGFIARYRRELTSVAASISRVTPSAK